MAISKKYGRTYHYPFSEGTTSDDRINYHYWEDISQISTIIHTEKLDGENNCLSRYGVFARSHVAPSVSPWTRQLRERWEHLKYDLGDLEIFGENLFAIHSIEYQQLSNYFYVFATRQSNKWLSWEETKFFAQFFDFPTVPEIKTIKMPIEKGIFEKEILEIIGEPSVFGSIDIQTQKPCSKEGIVSRNTAEYDEESFAKNVFKYVRKGHVKTNEHWTKNWKRASLIWQKGGESCGN